MFLYLLNAKRLQSYKKKMTYARKKIFFLTILFCPLKRVREGGSEGVR